MRGHVGRHPSRHRRSTPGSVDGMSGTEGTDLACLSMVPPTQDPENAVEDFSPAAARAPKSVGSTLRLGDEWLDDFPLYVCQIHPDLRSQLEPAVDPHREPI